MIRYLRLLLIPFSLLYGIAVFLRNKLYDVGFLKATEFGIPVICVGNLEIGGAGKTPATEYLVRLLPTHKIAILSRGYGRKTTGFVLAGETSDAETIGDEPLQYYRKFSGVTVAVCEDRVLGIRMLQDTHDLVILDDAFQHRPVKAGLSLLLFDYKKLQSWQLLLPAGNLREPFWGYKRADLIVVTKAPLDILADHRARLTSIFAAGRKDTVFAHLSYEALRPLFTVSERALSTITAHTEIFLITGIANPSPLLSHLKQFSAHVHHFDYPDHHRFSLGEIRALVNAFKSSDAADKLIITTEKDAQRLGDVRLKELLLDLPVFYLPIKMMLQEQDKTKFDQKIIDYVSSFTRNG